MTKKPCFSPKKGIFVYFLCSLSFCLNLFWPSTCSISLFLSLSLSLLSLLFCSFFLPSCLSFFAFFWFLLFLSFSFFFLLCFSEKNNMKFLNCNLFFHQYFLFFFGFLSCFCLSNPFFLSLYFPGIQLCFLLNINVFGFKKHKLRNTKGELQQNGVFVNNLCFEKCEKLSFFLPPFLAIF